MSKVKSQYEIKLQNLLQVVIMVTLIRQNVDLVGLDRQAGQIYTQRYISGPLYISNQLYCKFTLILLLTLST